MSISTNILANRMIERLGERGLVVMRSKSALREDTVLEQALKNVTPAMVLDVGANTGQFAALARECGYSGPVLSFEPLPDAHAELQRSAAGDPSWTVAPAMALGDHDGSVTMHVAGNSVSSSVLPMSEMTVAAAPQASYVDDVEVEIRTLDNALASLGVDIPEHTWLKVDVQGLSYEVLKGASATLPMCSAVQVELSMEPIYDGEVPTSLIFELLGKAGFEIGYIFPAFQSPLDRRFLQFDGIFTRRSTT